MNPPKNHFHVFNFRKFYHLAILYHIIYNFADFIFANLKKTKKANVICLKSFQQYGIITVLSMINNEDGKINT